MGVVLVHGVGSGLAVEHDAVQGSERAGRRGLALLGGYGGILLGLASAGEGGVWQAACALALALAASASALALAASASRGGPAIRQ